VAGIGITHLLALELLLFLLQQLLKFLQLLVVVVLVEATVVEVALAVWFTFLTKA
jgi:hypothetical protein